MRSLRRRITVVALASSVAAMTVAGAGQAAAGAKAGHRIPSVTSGDARFQVLSPTLIRTEYAQDGKFTDGATFNAIGRGAFTPPTYTTSTSNGWLTIRTSAVTVQYQVGSGPFTAQNLSVQVTAGGAPVTATPWQTLTCTVGALCEAEQLPYDGVGVAKDHTGYTGAGFLAGFQGTGNVTSNDKAPLTKVTLTVAAGASGSTSLYEDNGSTTKAGQRAATKIRYQETGSRHTVTISPTAGAFPGQVQNRQWTIALLNATAPRTVTVDKARLSGDDYRFDSATRTLTVTLPRRSVHSQVSFTY